MQQTDATPADTGHDDLDIPAAVRWRVVLLCTLVCLMDGFDIMVAPISISLMATDWALPPDAFSIALSAAVLGAGIGAAFVAPLGDRFGRRPVILVNFALMGISCLAVAFTTNVQQMAVMRLITGIGMGASLANALALVSEYAPEHLRSRVVACAYAMSAVGAAFGGLISPLLIERHGWEGIYYYGGGLPLFLLLFLIAGLPESRRLLAARRRTVDREAAAGTGDAPGPANPAGGIIRGIVNLFAADYRAATILVWLLYFFSLFSTYMITTWLPTLLTLYGWAVSDATYSVTAFSIGGILGGVVLGWLVDRQKTKTALMLAFGSAVTALALLFVVPNDVTIWLLLIVVMGAGTIGVSYALAAVASYVYPPELRAGGIGAAAAVGRLGSTVAPLIGGLLMALGLSAIEILTSLIGPLLLAMVIVQLFSRKLDRKAGA